MNNPKMDRLLELLEEISDLYPELSKIVMNDPFDPDYIILTTETYIEEMAESMGIGEHGEALADEWDDIEKKSKDKKKLQ